MRWRPWRPVVRRPGPEQAQGEGQVTQVRDQGGRGGDGVAVASTAGAWRSELRN